MPLSEIPVRLESSWETLRHLPTCGILHRQRYVYAYVYARRIRDVYRPRRGHLHAESGARKRALTIPRRLLRPCRVKGTRKLARPSYYVKPKFSWDQRGVRRDVAICSGGGRSTTTTMTGETTAKREKKNCIRDGERRAREGCSINGYSCYLILHGTTRVYFLGNSEYMMTLFLISITIYCSHVWRSKVE